MQQGQGLLYAKQQPLDVDVENLVEMGLGHLSQRRHFVEAGIGKEDIELAVLFLDRCIEAVEIGCHSDIALNADHLATQFFDGLVQFGLPPPRDVDGGAFFQKPGGSAEAQPCRATGD